MKLYHVSDTPCFIITYSGTSFLTLTYRLWSRLFGSREMRILMVGLDAAGKTTILYRLKLGEVVTTIPTIGECAVRWFVCVCVSSTCLVLRLHPSSHICGRYRI